MFELKRKLIHGLGLCVPVIYWMTSREYTLLFLGIAATGAVIIEVLRAVWEDFNSLLLKLFGKFARDHERTHITGATCFSMAALLVVALFSKPVAVSSLLFLTLGDSMAAVIGTRFGVHRIQGKSLEGSAACFGVCSVVGWCALGWVGVAGAAAATVVELLPSPLDDNVRIPLASGSVMHLLLI
ncbi:MAG: phosphatidate cytidylyltransferase [Theionarchaea archaeon]|nr:phosphatidate cytidylyltransferase [Theionarchaea archaeon]MBU7036633.1 phosphatidate cytidylyltransferase [Theionarchaea archaeon]